mmetsp:Transcript_114385/g.180657  ORF Transcript_114385/g.180657 Transcript_114385/m.180657 type:complete len:329 (-) Transcript_114385:108-1094(-)
MDKLKRFAFFATFSVPFSEDSFFSFTNSGSSLDNLPTLSLILAPLSRRSLFASQTCCNSPTSNAAAVKFRKACAAVASPSILSNRCFPSLHFTNVVGAVLSSSASSQLSESEKADTSSSTAHITKHGTDKELHASEAGGELGATRMMPSTFPPMLPLAAMSKAHWPPHALPTIRHLLKFASSNAASTMASKSRSCNAALICTFGRMTVQPRPIHPAASTTAAHSFVTSFEGGMPCKQMITPVLLKSLGASFFIAGCTRMHSNTPSMSESVLNSHISAPGNPVTPDFSKDCVENNDFFLNDFGTHTQVSLAFPLLFPLPFPFPLPLPWL